MTKLIILSFFIMSFLNINGQNNEPFLQKTNSTKIKSDSLKIFVENLKNNILNDTLKFNKEDLISLNGQTENVKKYSKMYLVGKKYIYRLDIIESEKIKEFGATNYKKIGFATENDIPKLESIEEFIYFLEKEDNIDIINCKIEIAGIGKLSTHDDGECCFNLDSREMTFDLIKKTVPIFFQDKILSELINNQNKYITIDLNGNLEKHFTFQDYIKNCL